MQQNGSSVYKMCEGEKMRREADVDRRTYVERGDDNVEKGKGGKKILGSIARKEKVSMDGK